MSKSLPLVEKYKSSRHPTRVKAAQFFFGKARLRPKNVGLFHGGVGFWVAGRKTAAYRYGFGQSKQAASVLLLTESEWVKHEQIILNLLVINQLI